MLREEKKVRFFFFEKFHLGGRYFMSKNITEQFEAQHETESKTR